MNLLPLIQAEIGDFKRRNGTSPTSIRLTPMAKMVIEAETVDELRYDYKGPFTRLELFGLLCSDMKPAHTADVAFKVLA